MTLKSFLQGYWFQRIVLFVWLVSSALVVFSQKGIDAIVHGTLYGYGLQFSDNWAQPYWTYARILYASQFACIALSIVALVSGFLKKSNDDKRVAFKNIQSASAQVFDSDKRASKREKTGGKAALKPERVEIKPALKPERVEIKPALKPERVEIKPALKRKQNANMGVSGHEKTEGRATGICCPNCKKTLSRAVVMLDFSDGKSTLVNVCPYCNVVLGKAEEQSESRTLVDDGKEVVR